MGLTFLKQWWFLRATPALEFVELLIDGLLFGKLVKPEIQVALVQVGHSASARLGLHHRVLRSSGPLLINAAPRFIQRVKDSLLQERAAFARDQQFNGRLDLGNF